jgi:hypothetical protein
MLENCKLTRMAPLIRHVNNDYIVFLYEKYIQMTNIRSLQTCLRSSSSVVANNINPCSRSHSLILLHTVSPGSGID